MKKILIILILLPLFTIQAKIFRRLDSEVVGQNQLKTGDTLLSTLGRFKFVLQDNNCQLTIYQFEPSSNTYIQTDTYVNSEVKKCNSLKVVNGQIITDNATVYGKLSSSNFQATWLTIDDNGSIRLIGVKQKKSQTIIPDSQQLLIKLLSNDKIISKNIISDSQFDLSTFSYAYTNDNDWSFIVGSNSLRILKHKDSSLIQEFLLQQINLDRSGIYDRHNRSPPYAIFRHALLFSHSNPAKSTCQLKAPYSIQIDQKWPVIRIYDQQKYLIAEYAFNNQNNFEKVKICPPATFLYRAECRKVCPEPYYSEIKGQYGQCVLTCQEGSFIDEKRKLCSSSQKDIDSNVYNSQIIKKCQREWSQYFYGCDCSPLNKFYDRINSLSCQTSCPNNSYANNGICLPCGENCLSCSRDPLFIMYLACDSCEKGYQLVNGQCNQPIQQCSNNCLQCNNSQCTKCSPFYSLKQGSCYLSCGSGFKETYSYEQGSVCISNDQSKVEQRQKCYVGCASCSDQNCYSCVPGYILFISPLATTCKLKSPNFLCSGNDYIYDSSRQICYVKNIDSLSMGKCKQRIQNCQACAYNRDNSCILCQKGYYLLNNKCVLRCPQNYIAQNNICIQHIINCKRQSYGQSTQIGNTNLDIITDSQSYKRHIANGLQPGNDAGGYSIYTKQFILQENTNNQTYPTLVRSFESICLVCRKGFGLSDDQTECKPCPDSCQFKHCYYARQNSCYKPTIKCTFLDENNNCLESCPQGSYPSIDQNNEARCLPENQSKVNNYLKIDSSYYLQEDGSKIYYFVLDKPIENNTVTARLLESHSPIERILVETETVRGLQENQYIGIRNTNENAVAIIFDESITQYRTSFGFTLANSVYGAEADYTHNQWMKQWLAHIGYILSWVILLVHCIYIGNAMLYKVDNLIIFCQTIYFFTFVKLLVGNTLSQFYYGWFWMHMGFYPNYFQNAVPIQYEEKDAPLSYKLTTLDGNLIRNAGYAISLFLTFVAIWFSTCIFLYLSNVILKRNQIWYHKIAKNTLIGAFQLLSMVIFFFSLSQLIYGEIYPQNQQNFHDTNVAFSIVFICFYSTYMCIRFFFNKIGGLYMFKRLAIALILVDAFEVEGYLALLIALQIVFSVLRYGLQKPRLMRQKVFIFCEGFSFIVSYFLLFLVQIAGVNVLIITIIIFVMILFFVGDLMDIYLQSRNEFYQFDIFGRKYDNQLPNEEDIPDSQRKLSQMTK